MAYVDFAEPHHGMPVQNLAGPIADPTPARLSPLEWSVVALAQRERLSSIDTPSRITVAMGKLLGLWRASKLADPRLEALRRLAVIAWHRGYAIHSSEIHAFKAAGFTMAQYELLLASISRGRNAVNQRVH